MRPHRLTPLAASLLLSACADPASSPTSAPTAALAADVSAASEASSSVNFVVNSTVDAVDASPGDGVCATLHASGGAVCTLRAAIQEANALKGAQRVRLPAGTYPLTLQDPSFEGGGIESGDLDVTDALTIAGAGVATTTIDCAGPGMCASINSNAAGIFRIRAGAVVISGVTLTRTTASSQLPVGAVHIDVGASLVMRRAAIRGQRTWACCAGIFNEGRLRLEEVTLADNEALSAAGGVQNVGTATIEASTFHGNRSGIAGGAIVNVGTLVLRNSTLSNNSAVGPGPLGPAAALYNAGVGRATLNGVTIVDNATPNCPICERVAGGIANIGTSAVLRISNSIVAGNTTGGDQAFDCEGTITSRGYNLIQTVQGCTIVGNLTGNLTGVDPLLAPLADNGGPTWTRALLPGSPAINAGSPAAPGRAAGACPFTDQRGVRRTESRCDIGAYEVKPSR